VFERFTDQARRVVVLAQEEARMLDHNYIGTEHLLLALLHEEAGVAAEALESLNISLEAARQQVEKIVGRGQAAPTGHLPFTPRARVVLELSLREALQLRHPYIGTEHLLLGLVREGEGIGAQILLNVGADMNRVRRSVTRRIIGDVLGTDEVPEALRSRPTEPLSPFEEAEKIVLTLLLQGDTTSGIAEILGVSKERVGEIIQGIVAKLGRILQEGDDG
jgi:ATP-dependent Clp protease ATP-binding subunit ClpA